MWPALLGVGAALARAARRKVDRKTRIVGMRFLGWTGGLMSRDVFFVRPGVWWVREQ